MNEDGTFDGTASKTPGRNGWEFSLTTPQDIYKITMVKDNGKFFRMVTYYQERILHTDNPQSAAVFIDGGVQSAGNRVDTIGVGRYRAVQIKWNDTQNPNPDFTAFVNNAL